MKKKYIHFIGTVIAVVFYSIQAQAQYVSLIASLVITGTNSVSHGSISSSSHYVYPNSNVTPLGATTSRVKKFSILIPPRFKAKDLDKLYGQALSKYQGSDLIINNKVDTRFTTIASIFKFMKVTLNGTAAHMEVGKQDIGQNDFVAMEIDSSFSKNTEPSINVSGTSTSFNQTNINSTPGTILPQKEHRPSFWLAIHGGLLQPMGKFKTSDLKLPVNEAVGAKPGYYVSLEFTNYFKSTLENPVKIGFTESISWSSCVVNWERQYQADVDFQILDLKTGFILSTKIGSALSADGYVRVGVNTAFGDYIETSEQNFAASFGTNLRWKMLIASLSANTGKAGVALYNGYNSNSIKVPTSNLRLGIGIKFGKA